MYTRFAISLKSLIIGLWKTVFYVSLYSALIYFAYYYWDFKGVAIPFSIPTVLGTAISLMLGFRTNAAYNRWWEARKIWGAVINDSRTLIRQAVGFITNDFSGKDEALKKLAYQQMAWCYSLNHELREQNTDVELNKYLDEVSRLEVIKHDNHHNAILQLQEKHLSSLYSEGAFDVYQFTAMDHTLKSLCDSMGKAERIKKTVFPVQYAWITKMSIFIFMLLLPFGMIEAVGIFVIPITFVVVFFFAIIDSIAKYMQDPFEDRSTDTPMNSICRTIEINLLHQIGEHNVPESIKPDAKGILM